MTVVAVFGSSAVQPEDPEYAAGVRLGASLAHAGHTVMTGGYAGIMEAVSQGARGAGGEVIGVTAPPVFPRRSGANGHVTVEIPAPSLTERIHLLIDLAQGFVVMSGSIGTLTELMMAWNVSFVAQFSDGTPKPIVAVGPQWGDLLPVLYDRIDTPPGYVRCVNTVEEAASYITQQLA